MLSSVFFKISADYSICSVRKRSKIYSLFSTSLLTLSFKVSSSWIIFLSFSCIIAIIYFCSGSSSSPLASFFSIWSIISTNFFSTWSMRWSSYFLAVFAELSISVCRLYSRSIYCVIIFSATEILFPLKISRVLVSVVYLTRSAY